MNLKGPIQPAFLQLKFGKDLTFQKELHRRVDEYFHSKGITSRDSPQMYLKSVIILITFVFSYVLLVFYAQNWWQAVIFSVFLGFTTAGIGFNIQHDGGHNSYSKHQWINKTAALTLDLIGGSSYAWHWKHTVIHHRYVNITDYDTDIEVGSFARLSPYQKLRPIHRWQHIYLWPLYGLAAVKWHLFDDFRTMITGKLSMHEIPRPKVPDLLTFFAGKAAFFSLAFFIPLMNHSLLPVILFYGITAVVLGITLSLIFQIPHCVEGADFPLPDTATGQMKDSPAVHMTRVTLDFSSRNKMLTWLVGGLNNHLEHHLFPVVCHVHYPALKKIVQQTCKDFGITYKEHSTFYEGITSHFRWLRQMGRP